jgi:hypothetical protein
MIRAAPASGGADHGPVAAPDPGCRILTHGLRQFRLMRGDPRTTRTRHRQLLVCSVLWRPGERNLSEARCTRISFVRDRPQTPGWRGFDGSRHLQELQRFDQQLRRMKRARQGLGRQAEQRARLGNGAPRRPGKTRRQFRPPVGEDIELGEDEIEPVKRGGTAMVEMAGGVHGDSVIERSIVSS